MPTVPSPTPNAVACGGAGSGAVEMDIDCGIETVIAAGAAGGAE